MSGQGLCLLFSLGELTLDPTNAVVKRGVDAKLALCINNACVDDARFTGNRAHVHDLVFELHVREGIRWWG